jgi:hypothetical protein
MNEELWLTSGKPGPMLEFLKGTGTPRFRKFRLFSVACCRRIWRLMTDERSCRAVTSMERHADRAIPAAEWTAYYEEASSIYGELIRRAHTLRNERNHIADCPAEALCQAAAAANHLMVPASRLTDLPGNPMEVSSAAAHAVCFAEGMEHGIVLTHYGEENSGIMLAAKEAEEANQVRLLRCIFGNPFRPIPPLPSALFLWNDGLIVRMANAIYDDRSLPSGEFGRDRVAVLADALEEVGADAFLVEHLRGAGPHVRGCVVVDMLTNRE